MLITHEEIKPKVKVSMDNVCCSIKFYFINDNVHLMVLANDPTLYIFSLHNRSLKLIQR